MTDPEPIELKDKHPSYLTENDIAELQKVKWLGEHYKSVFTKNRVDGDFS